MYGFPFSNGEVVQVHAILFVPDVLFLFQAPINTPFGAHEGKVWMPSPQVGHAVLRGKGSIGGLDRKKNFSLLRITGFALDAEPFPLTFLPIGQLDAF